MIFSLAAFSFLALAGSSLAQGAYFAYPQNGATIVAGNITIKIDRPTPSAPTVEAAIGLGMSSCREEGTGELEHSESCPSPEVSFEYLFYAGGFNPQRPTEVHLGDDFNAFQNFTVEIPASMKGRAVLGFLHSSFGRGAAGYFPFYEAVNVTVNVVEPAY
ncbi:hypothetical protein BT96DRAFT_933026 [Gymnopus androsaceus JB14]|uniref:Uncharacterized protein n=1 Tax=Gymnopus androsaceus JB14 TaxID=1447944 RepID=A0A6A4IFF2_9AGAR|nr:hypothetical protein BT96DRAFT_933026 [Gymnopus androsaceus JB14]